MSGLAPEEQDDLLRLARVSLRRKLLDDRSLDDELERVRVTPTLEEHRGAFVTLKRRTGKGTEALRGCIGSMTSNEPLHRNVTALVLKSAFEDPRFPPVTAAELPDLRIEISVLSPLREISGPREIEIGRHGVQMSRGSAGAVFLPQVAVEQRWTVEQLLQQLARKAGLDRDAWQESRLSVFEAQVFGEPKPEN